MSQPRIGMLIAAAGLSSRMGYHKALMPINDTSAMIAIAKQARKASLVARVITLPHALVLDPGICEELAAYSFIVRSNSFFSLGYAGSIKTMLDEWSTKLEGVVIMPIDAPLASVHLLHVMSALAKRTRENPTILVPHYGGRDGHPVYLSSHFFRELATCAAHGGMRVVIAHNERFRTTLLWPDTRIILNLNDNAELKRYQNLL